MASAYSKGGKLWQEALSIAQRAQKKALARKRREQARGIVNVDDLIKTSASDDLPAMTYRQLRDYATRARREGDAVGRNRIVELPSGEGVYQRDVARIKQNVKAANRARRAERERIDALPVPDALKVEEQINLLGDYNVLTGRIEPRRGGAGSSLADIHIDVAPPTFEAFKKRLELSESWRKPDYEARRKQARENAKKMAATTGDEELENVIGEMSDAAFDIYTYRLNLFGDLDLIYEAMDAVEKGIVTAKQVDPEGYAAKVEKIKGKARRIMNALGDK